MPPKKSKKVVEEPESCPVCTDPYTPVIRKKVICKFCKKDACSKCIEHYMVQQIEDAHCLHCRVNYDDTVLSEICTKTYLQNKYFKHRQEVLINRERANLPGLQESAIRERRRRQQTQLLQVCRNELNELYEKRDKALIQYNIALKEFHAIRTSGDSEKLKECMNNVRLYSDQCEDYRKQINIKRDEYGLIYTSIHQRTNEEETDEEQEQDQEEAKSAAASDGNERKKFIRRCPRTNCQGFLSTAWKCGICEYYSCNKCFKEKGLKHDDPHECVKEDLETAELIRKDSKPCPNCGEFITKHSGCDQMFCVSCQTPFSWNTGKIVTSGVIHNPHYFEWLKRNGQELPRNPGDVPCGGYPRAWEIRRFSPQFRNQYPDMEQTFHEFYRFCEEIQDMSTRKWQNHLTQDTLSRINIRFLLNDYDEKRWGQLLAQQERKRKLDAEIQEIFGAFRMVAVELINRFQNHHDPRYGYITTAPIDVIYDLMRQIQTEINALISMINDAFRNVSMKRRCAVPFITTVRRHYLYYTLLNRNYSNESKSKTIEQTTNNTVSVPPSLHDSETEDEWSDSMDDWSDSELTESSSHTENDTALQLAIDASLRIQ